MKTRSQTKKRTSGISSTSTGAEIIENAESIPHLQKELSMSSGKVDLLQVPFCGEYGDSRTVRLTFDGEIVDDLIEAIKKKLSPDVALNRITLRKPSDNVDLRPGLRVDESFKNDDELPLQVIVKESMTSKRKHEELPEDLGKIMESVAESAVEKVLSQQKPETIQASNLSRTEARTIMDSFKLEDFKRKKKEDFKEGQAIGELFIIDKISATKPMSVLTDCNDNWAIYFFMKTENHQYLASSKINDRSIALAIIKEFALDEGKFIHNEMGKLITYQVNLPEPLKKKSKFLESISEEVDDRISDIINNMTEKEIFNMSMRKRLSLAKSFVRIEEQPIIDQFIRQFSDDYENPPPLMYA
ncbi:hypothetical protein Glove_103g120 [Diversispora epigaea]|uniref:Uncharacterized protein n=1 Tax=Diversispora epigaea TaxID=1348612 RepID=A0A397JCC0_9GLOM|nr:hypothetical protein Glove_103g120 [Diversispora epigaea]